MADFIANHIELFRELGAINIVFWIYWTGVQENIEFTPEELQKIADSNIPLCIDYIQDDH